MGAETTQLRIPKALNERLRTLSSKTRYPKEDIARMILSECLDAIDADTPPGVPPHIENLRRELHKTVEGGTSLTAPIALRSLIREVLAEELNRRESTTLRVAEDPPANHKRG